MVFLCRLNNLLYNCLSSTIRYIYDIFCSGNDFILSVKTASQSYILSIIGERALISKQNLDFFLRLWYSIAELSSSEMASSSIWTYIRKVPTSCETQLLLATSSIRSANGVHRDSTKYRLHRCGSHESSSVGHQGCRCQGKTVGDVVCQVLFEKIAMAKFEVQWVCPPFWFKSKGGRQSNWETSVFYRKKE